MLYIRPFVEVAFLLIAQNKMQELILADQSLNKNEKYYCPSCQNPVHLKFGSIIRPHFAHFQNDACEVFAEGETFEHIEGKMQLAEWLENLGMQVEIEAYLPELQQRPDVLVMINNQQTAIEFQCSPIPIEKVAERTKGYLEAGYEITWILGRNFTYKDRLTAFHKVCLNKEMQLFHYDTEKEQLLIRSQFHLNQQEKMLCRKQRIEKGGELKSEPLIIKSPMIKHPNIRKRHNQLLRLRSEKKQNFQQLLYQNDENLISMPKELYTVLPNEWMIQEFSYTWKYRFILWIESQPKKKIITKKNIRNLLDTLTFHEIPQASINKMLKPMLEFLEVLKKSSCVKEIGNQKWSIHQSPKRYKFLEEKLRN